MGKATRAVLVCLLALLGVELGLRACAGGGPAAGGVGVDAPVVVLVGTSRSWRALRPRAVEDALSAGAAGAPAPAWVANASHAGTTAVGLLRALREDVLPFLRGATGWVGLELTGAALNDARIADDERPWLPRSGLPSAGGHELLARLRAGDLDAVAARLLGGLELVRARAIVSRAFARDAAEPPAWALGERGYEPYGKLPWRDLNAALLRERHADELLAGYTLGGLQTEAVRAAVADVRAAGLHPFVYVLPVTATQRGFWPEGGYAAYLAHARALAASLEVPFFDLDTGHELPDRAFYDANHVNDAWAGRTSALFAERVVARLLARHPAAAAEEAPVR